MSKPQFHDLFNKQVTQDAERVLVTLLRGLGPWRDSVFLIGGLAPTYLVSRRPPEIPAHAGTGDLDVVVDLALLADTEAYQTLEENLKAMGFARGENAKGQKVNWRWTVNMEHGGTLVLEFLADDPETAGGRVTELPAEGNVSALNIPYASMVFNLHDKVEVTVDLLDGRGLTTETIAYANIVSFTCLKAFAFDHRSERKDAHDLVYCLEHLDGGLDEAIRQFNAALETPHADTIRKALALLRKHFAPDPETGYRFSGPVAVARFELKDDEAVRDRRLLRQREVSDLLDRFLARVSPPEKAV